MEEIKVNLPELTRALCAVNLLGEDTGYKLPSTSEIMNLSSGKLFSQTNVLYRELMQIEDVMKEVVSNTKSALINAGIDFNNADNSMSEYISCISFETRTAYQMQILDGEHDLVQMMQNNGADLSQK